jgi:hypothetical protein
LLALGAGLTALLLHFEQKPTTIGMSLLRLANSKVKKRLDDPSLFVKKKIFSTCHESR